MLMRMICVEQDYQKWVSIKIPRFILDKPVVIADADLLSKDNNLLLEANGYPYII